MNSSDDAPTASNGGNNGGGFSSPVSLLSLVVLLGAVVAVLLVICFLYRRRQQRRLARQLRFTERRIDAVADNLKARKEQRALGGAAPARISIAAPAATRPVLPRPPPTPLGQASMEAQYETAPSLSSVPESNGWSRGRLQRGMIISSAEYIHNTYSAAPLRRTVTLPLPPPNTPATSGGVCSVSRHSTWGSAHSSRTVSLTNEDQEDAIPLSSSSPHNSTGGGGESVMDEFSSDGGQVERWV